MDGSRHECCDGTEGGHVMWGLEHERLQHAKTQQAKVDKAPRKQAAAAAASVPAETQTHVHPTNEEEDPGEEPIGLG